MKTIGTKLDNSEYDIFDFCCQEKGLTKSEQLRKLVKGFLDAPTPKQKEPIESTGDPPRPEKKVARISLDNGKTWYENGKQVV